MLEHPSNFHKLGEFPEFPKWLNAHFSDSNLVYFLKGEEFEEDFNMSRRWTYNKAKETLVEPKTKYIFGKSIATNLEVCLHNIRQVNIEEKSWDKHWDLFKKWELVDQK